MDEPRPYCKPHSSHFCPCCKPHLYDPNDPQDAKYIAGWEAIAPIVPIGSSSKADHDHVGMSQRQGQGETSAIAAEWITSKTGRLRRTVLWAIRNAPHGLTDEEGYTLLGMAANTWRPRRVELHKGWKDYEGGYIRDSGRRRKTKAGVAAIVWEPTMKGRRA